jgi:hypothetical protein
MAACDWDILYVLDAGHKGRHACCLHSLNKLQQASTAAMPTQLLHMPDAALASAHPAVFPSAEELDGCLDADCQAEACYEEQLQEVEVVRSAGWVTGDLLSTISCYEGLLLLTLPMASSPLSKNSSMPRKKNSSPQAVRPRPISAVQKAA